ncbi:conjugative transposon protein TraM [Chryseobacterium takakiae]|uniref:Conjugative transposon TraM C-terminal domain-containing protein n=1 Tax=Chryseobacterium takakiae TaxID=1302685 RepID=A0A1M5AWV1_9FLAO|nr:conjugative transposon protein TraM [Chryseobacterium takakiae]SHF34626.1 Protein of unknown function [Chryseobacterium takakiae]
MESKTENIKKKSKFDLKNISTEDRNKYFAYGVFGLAICGILAYGISNYTSDDTTEEVVEFSNPEAEQSKYNSKLEAINPKSPQQTSNALENTFTPSEETQANTDVDFQTLDRQLSELGSGKNVINNEPKPTQSGATLGPSNSHDVYGNYSMWQDKEPSNSKIGYSSKKNTVSSSPSLSSTSKPSYSEVTSYQPEQTYKEPSFSTYTEKQPVSIAQVKSKLISQGEASNNRSISFVILENFILKGETISKGKSYAVGSIQLENNRIYAKIHTIRANGKMYNVSGKIVGYDGEDGLPLSVNEGNGGTNAGEVLKDEAGRLINSVPVVGGMISRATSGGTRNKSNKISLSGNIECQIIIYK